MTNLNIKLSVELNEEQEERLYDFLCDELSHNDFLVLDEETKEAHLLESQEEMLWAFNTSFIMANLKPGISDDMSENDLVEFEKSIDKIKGDLCESANGFVKGITDWKELLVEGARVDGYGHFLSSYDGNEYELKFEGIDILVYKQ
ncbi:hypothetical protein MCCARTNEY_3 [Bacillus phage vB_BanH_McCartney]|nr:hypothetical protein MCCARTNEY_3 [Bacillus phage vB_BanH_McCartney]